MGNALLMGVVPTDEISRNFTPLVLVVLGILVILAIVVKFSQNYIARVIATALFGLALLWLYREAPILQALPLGANIANTAMWLAWTAGFVIIMSDLRTKKAKIFHFIPLALIALGALISMEFFIRMIPGVSPDFTVIPWLSNLLSVELPRFINSVLGVAGSVGSSLS